MWTREDEMNYESLNNKRNQCLKNAEYSYDLFRYFDRELKGVELSQDTLYGEEEWIDNILGTYIAVKAKCDIDSKEFNDYIYCCLFQKDCYYNVLTSKTLYFEYENYIYELLIESCNYEYKTGNYSVIVSTYVYDNKDFKLDLYSIEGKQDQDWYNNNKVKPIVDGVTCCLSLGKDLNIISEIIKKYDKENISRKRTSNV